MSWFANWFDSKYYHLLYQHRDEAEAAAFIDVLTDYLTANLGLSPDACLLDMACGKGRHALHLADKGYSEVVGLDLSPQSILAARQYERDGLRFFTQDMRRPYSGNYFDAVFNFFTSFGYFPTEKQHADTLKYVAQNLKANGIFVLDFMNAPKVVAELVPEGEKTADGVHFTWRKKIENGFICKKIEFAIGNNTYEFEERVRAFSLSDLELLLRKSGLNVVRTFGNYQLDAYSETYSDRMIIVARKG